ncbi:Alpha-mannosidase [Armadillidium vulgare]|nr:Alpha-mannosidase [Armadillidium vulgare]
MGLRCLNDEAIPTITYLGTPSLFGFKWGNVQCISLVVRARTIVNVGKASLFAQMGMDGELFARVDYRDKVNRWDSRRMEMIWKSSHSLGEDSWIFTGVLPHHYEPPSGFCFDNQCGDDPIMDDPNLEDYNKDDKVRSFIQAVNYEVTGFISNQNIIMTMGSDFHYVNANSWYKNLDKLKVVKQFASLTGSSADESIKTLAEALGVLQHHDAVAGEDSWIFTGVLPHHYEPPSGFCFDNQCGDDPIMDDPNLEDYNKDDKVRSFIEAVNYELTGFISNQNIIMTMGSDFHLRERELLVQKFG